MFDHEYIDPIVRINPQNAFYSDKRSVKIEESVGMISGEFVMAYPPGIPILAPGEEITSEIVEYIKYAKDKGCVMQGTKDTSLRTIFIIN